jgi:hypothetical protein
VLPQEPQLLVSVCRSLQASGVVPQREEVEPEHGQTVSVAVAISVIVAVGVIVRVVEGTVTNSVSVNSMVVVVDVIVVKVMVSKYVETVVKSSVACVIPRQPHAVEMVSQAYPVRRAMGALSQVGLGARVGVIVGVVKIAEEAVGPPVGSTVELPDTCGTGIREEAVAPPP